jgi:hypothetical protein
MTENGDPRRRARQGEANGGGPVGLPASVGLIALRRSERRDPWRIWLVAAGLGLAGFWTAVVVAAIVLLGDDGDPTELGSTPSAVTRCSVVMPEDLDR